jgi:MFS family permease
MATTIDQINSSEPPKAQSRLKETFRAMRVRNYRLYWFGQLISISGTWMQTTAQAWVVYTLTNSPLALGTVTTLQFLPITLLTLFGGVIADRAPKRQLVLITQTLALVQATIFGILVATNTIQVWHMYILAAVQGIINAIDQPVRQAFAAELVSNEDRPNAVALNSMLFNAARIVGPAAAGILIAQTGAAPALFINAASFLAVIIAIILMNPAEFFIKPMKRVPEPAMKQLAEGLRYSRRTPAVLIVLILVGFIGTFGYNFSVVIPLLGGFVLKTDAAGFGLLSAALGIGSLLGAISTAVTRKITIGRLITGAAGFSIFFALLAVNSDLQLAMLLLAIVGFFGVLFSTNGSSLIQITVPDHLRGRVTSLYFLLFAGSTPIGATVIGTLSSTFNVTDALLFCAALCSAGVLIAWLYNRRVLHSDNHQLVEEVSM